MSKINLKRKGKIEPTEKDIQRQILEWLAYQGIFSWRNNTGAIVSEYKGKQRFMRFGMKGSPDIIGILKDGKFLAIEVKRKGGKMTSEQIVFFERINENGGVAILAYKLEDVMKELK